MRKPGWIITVVILILLAAVQPVKADQDMLRFYYSGEEDSDILVSLQLTDFLERVDDPVDADVLIVNGSFRESFEPVDLVRTGTGLVIFLSKDSSEANLSRLLGAPVSLEYAEDPASLAVTNTSADRLVQGIVWQSSPQVRERMQIVGSGLTPVVTAYENQQILLGTQLLGAGRVYVFTPFLDDANPQIRDWAYFNYLIYFLAADAGGQEPLSFGNYPASPVPHQTERVVLYFLMVGLLLVSGTIFYFVRRYSLAHPEMLNQLVANRKEFENREAGTAWERIGFHRPVGGFMFALMSGLILFIPLIIYQNLILPVYILPSAQAMGIWGRVASFFPIIWNLFDMGTSVAHIKFFSEFRVRDPQRAVKYAQFFVWWQALSGAIQVAMVTALASAFLPETVYAMYIWAVIAHTLIQIPGFFMIMSDNLTALQRSDYNQIVDIAANMVIPMATQPLMIAVFVWWGKNNPVFGSAMGGVLGLAAAAYATQAVSFLFGLWLYRRIGYNARLLFLAHFDWSIAKESFQLGIFLVISGLIGGLGSSLQVLVIQSRLINNNEILGNLGMAGNFVFAYSVLLTLSGNAMPAISEAFSNGRKVLSQYYTVMVYKYGGFVSAFLAAILLAVADRFILGSSGKEFERAALYSVPLILTGALQFASNTGDIVMFAANKTRLVTLFALLGLGVNFGIAYVLIDRWQVNAIILTGFIGLLLKDILVYFVNDRYIFKQRFFFWQTLIAPILAGGVHYVWLRWATGLIWKGDELSSMLIFLIALLPSYPVFAFLYGFFGGWDDATLAEFGLAAELSAFIRPMTRLFYRASVLGARVSPLHNRFPITIRAEAMQEADALTRERVSLVPDRLEGNQTKENSTHGFTG